MNKIKIIIILLISCLLLCSCKNLKNIEVDENADYNSQLSMMTYCDKKYGVEYIIFIDSYKGGITVRLDSDGNVIHC